MTEAGPAVSVIVVTFDSAATISACLGSLDGAGSGSFEVVVVDNGSSDGSVGLVRAACPQATVVPVGANLGFSAGCNLGMRRARGRHLLLLNPDTVMLPGALGELVAFLDAHPGAGVAAPKLLNADLTDQGTARSFPTPAVALFGRRSWLSRTFPGNRWTRRYLTGRSEVGAAPFEVDWVSGACFAVPRRVVDDVGPLDEGFFMYWEDADWCRRIRAAGYSVHCVPAARVTHDEGTARQGWAPRQVVRFHRSAYRYYAKHELCGSRRPLRAPLAAGLGARAAVLVAGAWLRKGTGPAASAASGPPVSASSAKAAIGGTT